MKVLYYESRPEESYAEQNTQIDKWYKQLAVSEERMDSIIETYEHIKDCLKKEEIYLFTG